MASSQECLDAWKTYIDLLVYMASSRHLSIKELHDDPQVYEARLKVRVCEETRMEELNRVYRHGSLRVLDWTAEYETAQEEHFRLLDALLTEMKARLHEVNIQ